MSSCKFVSLMILIGVGFVAIIAFAATTTIPTITLEKVAHFKAPNGDDVVLGPGTFEVEATNDGLRLKPKDGKPEDAKLIQAQSVTHVETLNAPKALSEAVGEDAVRVALHLPDGNGMEAMGSSSGVRTRGYEIQSNTSYGTAALPQTSSGLRNSAFGALALGAAPSGNNNTAVGHAALAPNTSGMLNTAVGASALIRNITGNNNTAVGANALAFNTVSDNTAVGNSALTLNGLGIENVAVGHVALKNNTSGSRNTAVGLSALLRNSTSSGNTAVGAYALLANTGENNTV